MNYEDVIAPSGATFVHAPGSAWTGNFVFAALRGEQLRRVTRRWTARPNQALFEGAFGRLRTVTEGPDGALYVLTNNTDGRGSPREGDDRVIRIVRLGASPQQPECHRREHHHREHPGGHQAGGRGRIDLARAPPRSGPRRR